MQIRNIDREKIAESRSNKYNAGKYSKMTQNYCKYLRFAHYASRLVQECVTRTNTSDTETESLALKQRGRI